MEIVKIARLSLVGAVLVAGCASYSGSGLVPGKSTAADVEQLMGPPKEKIGVAGGDSVWFYPRNPAGRHTYAVRVAPDGVVRAIDQRLTVENMQKLVAGATTANEVRELFGPPNRVTHLNMQERDVWEYRMLNPIQIPYNLYVQYSADGIVREVLFLRDPSQDMPAAGGRS
jgi:hypothetical protein